MTDPKKLELIRKVKALADHGTAGERTAAKARLEFLLEKYGIDSADLSYDKISLHWFHFDGRYGRKLLSQIAFKIISSDSKTWVHRSGKGKRTELGFDCTDAEALQIKIEYEFYQRLLDEEMLLFVRAFIKKHDIFPPSDKISRNPSPPLSSDELLRMSFMMDGMQDATMHKMIAGTVAGVQEGKSCTGG